MHTTQLSTLLLLALGCASVYGSQSEVTYAFAVDDTGSMGGEIKAVREGILELLKIAPEAISNYVVVLFNDPTIGPWIKSNNVKNITRFLQKIHPHAGGDCPEMAMKGLRKAVELSDPGSFVFFFSDASAKDYALQEVVAREAKAKDIMILFVLTGCCGRCDTKGHNAYRNITSDTGGRMYQVSKTGAEEFMNYTVLVAAKDALLMRYTPATFSGIVNITKTGVVPFGGCNQLVSCSTFGMVLAISLLATLVNSNIKNLQSVFV